MARIFLTAQGFDIFDGDDLDLFARTGSTSVEQIVKAGAEGVILGHPETGDSPATVKMKLKTVVDRADNMSLDSFNKITLMTGEAWEDFQNHGSAAVAALISKQIATILSDIPETFITNFVIGYDPKWGSRGSGHDDAPPPEPDLISQVASAIRADLVTKYGQNLGSSIPIIYGGRSTPERTLVILSDPNIAGLILGSACNTVEKTESIIDSMQKAKPKGQKVLHANFKAFNLSDSYEDYVKLFRGLDDSFTVYISPCHADLRKVADVLA